ncbi:MAG: hypothetical protein KTR31_36375 [Myxococcales bacterium]|nr:hypothetical protein [Myxococcales bacterium]
MFAGHYAPALLARRVAPEAPLWALLLAAQAVDFGFMFLGLAGVEGAALQQEAPRLVITEGVWTHSVPMTVVWSVAMGALAWLVTRRGAVAVAIGLVTASHWLTDLLVHTPDLPLGFVQEPAVGLSLWLYPPASWVLEVLLLLAATAWLAPRLAPAQRRRVWGLTGILVLLQSLSEWVLPPPITFSELAVNALLAYVLIAVVGWWVERVR